MTTIAAAGAVRDITPHPHEQRQQYDSECLQQQQPSLQSSAAAAAEPDYDNHVCLEKPQHHFHNNNSRSHPNQNHLYKKRNHHHRSKNGSVKVKAAGRRRAGRVAPNNNLSSDYDNVVPAAAPVRLSRVEEEGGDGGEQQQRHHHGADSAESIAGDDSVDEDPISNSGDHSTNDEAVTTVNGDAEQKITDAAHSEPSRGSNSGGECACSGEIVSEKSTHETKQRARREEGGAKTRDEQRSQNSGADVDNDGGESSESAALRSVSVSSVSVGIGERLLSGSERSICNNNHEDNNRNYSTVDEVQEDYHCSIRDGGVDLKRETKVDSEKDGLKHVSNDVINDCNVDKPGKELYCDSDSKDVDNVISDSEPLDTEERYNGTEDTLEEESIPFANENSDFSTIKMGAKHSRRPKGDLSNGVADDPSKIEMKEYSRKGDSLLSVKYSKSNGSGSLSDVKSNHAKSFDQIHGEIIDDENRSLSLDSYQTIPEYPEEYCKLSVNTSFEEGKDKATSSTPISFASVEQMSVTKTQEKNTQLKDALGPKTVSEKAENDPPPIYAVVNKKKWNGVKVLPKKRPGDDPELLMDGDYSVPSWGDNSCASKTETVVKTNTSAVNQWHHHNNVSNPKEYREIVSASVSVSSLASSKPDSKSLANNNNNNDNNHHDDEYDDAFMDPNSVGLGVNRLKKSSTLDSMNSANWRGSLKFPRSHSTSYDYFSLGRRPKLKRSHTLVDAHGKAVSMDTLLKARRNCGSVTETADHSLDNLSVEDILKSCEDFDSENKGFRSRSESANSMTISGQQLGFFMVKEEGEAPVLTNERVGPIEDDRRLNNLNESGSKDSNDSNPSPIPSPGQTMNIVNGEDVELRPRLQVISQTQYVGQSHSNHLSQNATASIPPTYSSLTTEISTVQCAAGPVSNSSDLTTPPAAGVPSSSPSSSSSPSFSPHIPPSSTSSQTTTTSNGVISTDASLSPSSISSTSSSSKSTSMTISTMLSPNQPATSSHQRSQHSTATPVSSKSQLLEHEVDSNNTASPAFPTPGENSTSETSTTLVTSPLIKFHPDFSAGTGTDHPPLDMISTRLLSPFTALSVEGNLSTSSPSSMTSLTVDVSSSSLEGNTLQNSSPAPRSPNSLAKLEAVEALKWLRAAGFPQYAQMFDDGLFPIELALVEKDHDFLDKDSIQSLFRRLETLNKYAGMKIDAHQRKKAASEEDEEDDICALSERWEYQKSVRRWSRKDLALSPRSPSSAESAEHNVRGSHDSLLADQDSESQTGDSPLLSSKMPHKDNIGVPCVDEHGSTRQVAGAGDHQNAGGFPISPRLRRVASERIKTAKNLWKKMEGGLKSKKSRRHPRNIMEISDPVVADQENMQAKLQRLNCVDISPTSEQLPGSGFSSQKDNSVSQDGRVSSPSSTQSPPSSLVSIAHQQSNINQTAQTTESYSLPIHSRLAHESQSPKEIPSPAYSKDRPEKTSSDTPSSHETHHSISSSTDSSLKEYYSAQSQLLRTLESAHPSNRSNSFRKNSNDTGLMEIFLLPQDHQPGKFPRLLQNGYIEKESRGVPGNSLYGREIGPGNRPGHLGNVDPVGGNRVSVYDNFSTSSDGSRRVTEKSSRLLGEIHEDESKSGNGSDKSGNCDSYCEDTKINKNNDVTQSSYRELKDKILKEASSPALPLAEVDSEGQPQGNSFTYSKGVSHSVSVDSYLTDNGNSSHQRNSSGSISRDTASSEVDTMLERSLSEQYDEFDLILKEMYANISDLTRRVEETVEDPNLTISQGRISATTTTPIPHNSQFSDSTSHPGSSHKQKPVLTLPTKTQGDLHHQQGVATLDTDVVPMSPNSDPILSPSSPLSPQLGDDSVDTDGVTDPDNENSSSGGGDSHTGESISDPEVGLDLSHDDSLEQIPAMSRERRDSGVGHSLTRASSDRRRKKLRWHSFQKCHRPDVSSRSMQINSLTVGQLVWLQKLSLLKLTGIMEKCLPVNKSGWNWMMPRFMKRNKTPDFSDKNVFGVPLSVMVQRTGQPLPQCVLYAMRYLRRTSQHAVGIFRKSGVKSKIQSLIDHLEANPDTTDFEDMNAYNVADMIKTFFRDLPECLLTNKLSETFRSIYTHVPKQQLLEAIQAAILLLPDENREVLQSLLLFLSDISMHEADHQMNAVNLAVCFTPTVFMLGYKQTPLSHSPKRNRKAAPSAPGVPDPREIMEQKTSQDCLLLMITECKKLFTVPPKLFRQVQTQSAAFKESSPVFELSGDEGTISDEIRAFGQERVQKVLKEAHDKNRGWIPFMHISNIEINQRKPMDDCPLKEWKLVVDIDAPPIEVLRRIMHERHAWDEDLLSWSVVERLDPHSDIFQYVLNSMAPHPSRHFCVIRYWRADLSKGACALITMSVDHGDIQDVQGVMAIDFGSFYLMEPCGSGRSRLTHITRVDSRGRCPEWYSKVFGHIAGNFIERLRDSFKQETSGPETKV